MGMIRYAIVYMDIAVRLRGELQVLCNELHCKNKDSGPFTTSISGKHRNTTFLERLIK